MVIRQVKSLFRLAELAIILVAVALAYLYRDVVKETYDSASTYVREINQRLASNGAEPGVDRGATVAVTGVVPGMPESVAPALAAEGRGGGAGAVDAREPAATPPPAPAAAPSRSEGLPAEEPVPAAPALQPATAPEGAGQPAASAATSAAAQLQTPGAEPAVRQIAALAPQVSGVGSEAQAASSPGAGELGPAPDSQQAVSLAALLADAGAAVKEGRVTEALALYQTAVREYPDSVDAYRELGNIHYSKRQFTEAASNYYQAGVRLLTAGNVREAERLHRLIKPLNPALASSLETKLMLHRLKRR